MCLTNKINERSLPPPEKYFYPPPPPVEEEDRNNDFVPADLQPVENGPFILPLPLLGHGGPTQGPTGPGTALGGPVFLEALGRSRTF